MTSACSLCDSSQINSVSHPNRAGVRYWHCQNCDLIFIDPDFLLSSIEEKARYETHENIEGDADYEKFLGQLWQPMKPYLSAAQSGIDFGSGPGPALQKMIQRDGFQCAIFDPYYANDETVLSGRYDFAVSTEVVEHFNFPKHAWRNLLSLIHTGGVLGVMTQFHPGGPGVDLFFAKWWYPRDPAHVCFYSEKTLSWIFEKAGFEILEMHSPIVIARRTTGKGDPNSL